MHTVIYLWLYFLPGTLKHFLRLYKFVKLLGYKGSEQRSYYIVLVIKETPFGYIEYQGQRILIAPVLHSFQSLAESSVCSWIDCLHSIVLLEYFLPIKQCKINCLALNVVFLSPFGPILYIKLEIEIYKTLYCYRQAFYPDFYIFLYRAAYIIILYYI